MGANKTKIILISAFIAVIVVLSIAALAVVNQSNLNRQHEITESASEKNENIITFTAEANKTVLEQLKTKAQVVMQDSPYGPFISSVNGKISGGDDNKYWVLYINDQMSQVVPSEYITKGDEKIEWKYE